MTEAEAVTAFLARMACRQERPCRTCLDFCRTALTPRALPLLREAFRMAALTGRADEGWNRLALETALAPPNTTEMEEDDEPWRSP